MKKRIGIAIIISILVILGFIFSGKIVRLIEARDIIFQSDYIEVPSDKSKIYIKSIKTIEPSLWKGSYDGILHLKNGREIKIDISFYGNFFGIKGGDKSIFSNENLFEYAEN